MTRDTVPEAWRWPLGRWRQAPPEFGGKFWYLSPFEGDYDNAEEPWKNVPLSTLVLPPGFEDVFGPEPKASDFPSGEYRALQGALNQWKKDLGLFAEAGRPGTPISQFEADRINSILASWGVPAPKYFRFTSQAEDSALRGEWQALIRFGTQRIQAAASLVIGLPGLAVAEIQADLLQRGVDPTSGDPTKRHPRVPPQLWPDHQPVHGE